MDHIRQDLNELMGRDRDHPLHIRLKKRDHFDDEDVCKFNLVNFCPHDLFPNTKADLGPQVIFKNHMNRCQKRHDEFFKDMFKADVSKSYYQRKYEQELIDLLEKLIGLVDVKIKKSLQRIEQPVPDHMNLPEMNQLQQETVQQKIEQLEQKINFYVEKGEKIGLEGKMDEYESLMKEVDKLKMQKSEIEALSDNTLLPKEKNMKVCEVCGALQATTDTDKRMIMHLEGKLHTGYQKVRKVLNELKQKREEHKKIREMERAKGKRSKSRTPSPVQKVAPTQSKKSQNAKAEIKAEDKFEDHFYFSSRALGSGINIPDKEDQNIRYADMAILHNNENMMGQLPLANSVTLGKEWGYYKKNIDKQKREEKKKEDGDDRRDDRRDRGDRFRNDHGRPDNRSYDHRGGGGSYDHRGGGGDRRDNRGWQNRGGYGGGNQGDRDHRDRRR